MGLFWSKILYFLSDIAIRRAMDAEKWNETRKWSVGESVGCESPSIHALKQRKSWYLDMKDSAEILFPIDPRFAI